MLNVRGAGEARHGKAGAEDDAERDLHGGAGDQGRRHVLHALHQLPCEGHVCGPSFKANWNSRPLWDLWDWISNKMPKNDPGSLSPAKSWR